MTAAPPGTTVAIRYRAALEFGQEPPCVGDFLVTSTGRSYLIEEAKTARAPATFNLRATVLPDDAEIEGIFWELVWDSRDKADA